MNIPLGIKKNAVCCILENNNRFLLLKRTKNPHKDNYIPVGGKIDPFESPLKAAVREVREETGIKISKPKFCGIMSETSPTKYNWNVFVYKAEIEDTIPITCNEGILEWIHKDNLSDIKTPETDLHIYEYVAADKPFMFDVDYNKDLELIQLHEEIEGKLIVAAY